MARLGTVTHIVVHHSASRLSTTFDEIKRWHTQPKPPPGQPKGPQHGNGWADIGYHFIILGAGKLVVGRDLGTRGAHAPPNRGKIGICVVGDNRKARSSWRTSQVKKLKEVIAALKVLYPDAVVVGHRDAGRTVTECPGVELAALHIT